MHMSNGPLERNSVGLAADAWLRYLELLDDFRPDLYRYCRRLTGNVWDAEDLVQDTLEQGFAHLGLLSNPIDNPRAESATSGSNAPASTPKSWHRKPSHHPNATAPCATPAPRCSSGWRRRNARPCCSRRRLSSLWMRSPSSLARA
jgi:RNA polymerase sigma-70 factor (ECF subfamily)